MNVDHQDTVVRIAAEILAHREKLSAYLCDPAGALADHSLTPEEHRFIRYCIDSVVNQQDGQLDAGMHYEGPEPHIAEMAPDIAVTGMQVEVKVRGEAIVRSAELHLIQRGAEQPYEIPCKVRSVTGTFRNSTLEASVDLRGAPPGDYDVHVFDPAGILYLNEIEPRPTKDEWPGLPPLVNYFPFRVLRDESEETD